MSLESLRPVVDQVLAGAKMAGLSLAVARGGGPAEHLIVGADAAGQPLARDSLLTVASITKLATSLVVLRLVERGLLALDEPLATYLPEAAAAQPGVTIRRLLSHSAGLAAEPVELKPYRPGLDWPTLRQACLVSPLAAPPMTRVQYSNLGYGLLAIVVERLVGWSFATALRTLVLEPLGVEGYLGEPPPRRLTVLADVRSPQAGTPLEPFNSAFWHSLAMPWGGLITTIDGALSLVRAFRGQLPPGFLQPATLAEATANQTDELGGGQRPPLIWERCPWGLGPELRGLKQPHWAPPEASPDSFGHAGASGCLAWADPTADVAWAGWGARSAHGGWLLRYGTQLGSAILSEA